MGDIHFDFEALLVIASAVTGVFWVLDKLIWAPRREAARQEGDTQVSANWAVEFSRSFFPVILFVLLLRSFVVEPFRIPSSSMVPTLLVGDFILVNKFAYGFRLPVVHTKVIPVDEPERGDVMVFRWPPDPSKDFIKRVVGLPGDEILYRDKHLSINGEPVPLESLGVYTAEGVPAFEAIFKFSETLGEKQHPILMVGDRESLNLRATVPPGEYFVMGDNRDNSLDSRRWGFVPERNLVGKAFLVWMSVDTSEWDVRFGRLGSLVK